ncbi:MAG: glycosyltransferase [Bifidobacteriaceae bacterium]|jgi:hypothetical protein|nr:glycosyltransferase [Bifidobacteriaceae bacterium]
MSTTNTTSQNQTRVEQVDRIGESAEVSVDIVLPIHNQAAALDSHVRALRGFLCEHAQQRGDFTWNIVLADMASTDATWEQSQRLAGEFPGEIRALRMEQEGRGHALKIAWGESRASVVSYMDLALSADIKDIGFLIGSLLVGGADIAIGSRLLSESQVSRTLRREFISRTYNMLLHSYLNASFHDAQCGFKAVTAQAAKTLLPLICDDGLFFDTEMLLLAQNAGLLIYEIPVVWNQPIDDGINVTETIQRDLEGMRRMKRTFAKGVTKDGMPLPWVSAQEAALEQESHSDGSAAASSASSSPSGDTAHYDLSAPILYDTSSDVSSISDPYGQLKTMTLPSLSPRQSAAKAFRGPVVHSVRPVSSVGSLARQTMLIDVASVRVK